MQQRVGDLFKIQPPAANRGLLMLSGTTVPTDGADGYQTGCIFQHIDGSGSTALYVNEGSVTSCDFNALDGGIINTTPGTLAAGEAVVLDSAGAVSGSFTGDGTDNWGFWQLTVTNPTGSTAMRALRVNCNPASSATVGDTQAIHSRVTVPASTTFATGSACHADFAWLIVGNSTTPPPSGVIAAYRAIFNVGTNDFTNPAFGTESAIFYGQTWATAGKIDAGLRIAAGAGSTIDAAISIGGPGTYNAILDLTDWGADTLCRLLVGGPKDAGATESFGIWIGDAASTAAVQAACPVAAMGSLYLSTTGVLFICTANDTWQTVTST